MAKVVAESRPPLSKITAFLSATGYSPAEQFHNKN
jgi:hypothetical protein